jgi:MYND finger
LNKMEEASVAEKAAPILNAPVVPIRWTQIIELGYSIDKAAAGVEAAALLPVCFGCGNCPASTSGIPAKPALDKGDQDAAVEADSSPAPSCPGCGQALGAAVADSSSVLTCPGCGHVQTAKPPPLSKCGQCKVASYCRKECQVSDWKCAHKLACASYARVSVLEQKQKQYPDMADVASAAVEVSACAQARNEIFARIRFYACPYAVTKETLLGRGFLFVQSDQTLVVQSLALPKDVTGRSTGMRSVMVHYLTLGEYDLEVCREDFEMTAVRGALQQAVADYDVSKEVVVLMRFRCGHVALGTAVLVPDYSVCKALGREYYASDASSVGALQLNLDDV